MKSYVLSFTPQLGNKITYALALMQQESVWNKNKGLISFNPWGRFSAEVLPDAKEGVKVSKRTQVFHVTKKGERKAKNAEQLTSHHEATYQAQYDALQTNTAYAKNIVDAATTQDVLISIHHHIIGAIENLAQGNVIYIADYTELDNMLRRSVAFEVDQIIAEQASQIQDSIKTGTAISNLIHKPLNAVMEQTSRLNQIRYGEPIAQRLEGTTRDLIGEIQQAIQGSVLSKGEAIAVSAEFMGNALAIYAGYNAVDNLGVVTVAADYLSSSDMAEATVIAGFDGNTPTSLDETRQQAQIAEGATPWAHIKAATENAPLDALILQNNTGGEITIESSAQQRTHTSKITITTNDGVLFNLVDASLIGDSGGIPTNLINTKLIFGSDAVNATFEKMGTVVESDAELLLPEKVSSLLNSDVMQAVMEKGTVASSSDAVLTEIEQFSIESTSDAYLANLEQSSTESTSDAYLNTSEQSIVTSSTGLIPVRMGQSVITNGATSSLTKMEQMSSEITEDAVLVGTEPFSIESANDAYVINSEKTTATNLDASNPLKTEQLILTSNTALSPIKTEPSTVNSASEAYLDKLEPSTTESASDAVLAESEPFTVESASEAYLDKLEQPNIVMDTSLNSNVLDQAVMTSETASAPIKTEQASPLIGNAIDGVSGAIAEGYNRGSYEVYLNEQPIANTVPRLVNTVKFRSYQPNNAEKLVEKTSPIVIKSELQKDILTDNTFLTKATSTTEPVSTVSTKLIQSNDPLKHSISDVSHGKLSESKILNTPSPVSPEKLTMVTHAAPPTKVISDKVLPADLSNDNSVSVIASRLAEVSPNNEPTTILNEYLKSGGLGNAEKVIAHLRYNSASNQVAEQQVFIQMLEDSKPINRAIPVKKEYMELFYTPQTEQKVYQSTTETVQRPAGELLVETTPSTFANQDAQELPISKTPLEKATIEQSDIKVGRTVATLAEMNSGEIRTKQSVFDESTAHMRENTVIKGSTVEFNPVREAREVLKHELDSLNHASRKQLQINESMDGDIQKKRNISSPSKDEQVDKQASNRLVLNEPEDAAGHTRKPIQLNDTGNVNVMKTKDIALNHDAAAHSETIRPLQLNGEAEANGMKKRELKLDSSPEFNGQKKQKLILTPPIDLNVTKQRIAWVDEDEPNINPTLQQIDIEDDVTVKGKTGITADIVAADEHILEAVMPADIDDPVNSIRDRRYRGDDLSFDKAKIDGKLPGDEPGKDDLGEGIPTDPPPWEDNKRDQKMWLIQNKTYPAWNNWSPKKTR